MALRSARVHRFTVVRFGTWILSVALLGDGLFAQEAPGASSGPSQTETGANPSRPIPTSEANPGPLTIPSSVLSGLNNSLRRAWSVDDDVRPETDCSTCGANLSRFNGLAPPNIIGRMTYADSGGSSVSFGLIGSRVSRLPLFMSTTLGTQENVPLPRFFVDAASGVSQWTVAVSGEKVLKRTTDGQTFSVVGDLFVPLKGSKGDPSQGMRPSTKGGRLGLAFEY